MVEDCYKLVFLPKIFKIMKKIIVFSLIASLGLLTACGVDNAAAKVDMSKLEAAKKRY